MQILWSTAQRLYPKKKKKKEEVPLLQCSFGVSGKLGDLHGLLAKKNISVHAGIEASVNGTAWLKDLFGSQEAQTVKSTNQPPDKEEGEWQDEDTTGVDRRSVRCQRREHPVSGENVCEAEVFFLYFTQWPEGLFRAKQRRWWKDKPTLFWWVYVIFEWNVFY